MLCGSHIMICQRAADGKRQLNKAMHFGFENMKKTEIKKNKFRKLRFSFGQHVRPTKPEIGGNMLVRHLLV